MHTSHHTNLNIRAQKNEISYENYFSESDEEDQRREDEEIKRIIIQAKNKHNSKPNIRAQTTPHNIFHGPPIKQEPSTGLNHDIKYKTDSFQGFFPKNMISLNTTQKRDFAGEFERLNQLRMKLNNTKTINRSGNKARDIRAILDIDNAFGDYEAQESKGIVNNFLSPKKPPTIGGTPKDKEIHKKTFNTFISFFSKSTSEKPFKLFADQSNLPSLAETPRGGNRNSNSKKGKREPSHVTSQTLFDELSEENKSIQKREGVKRKFREIMGDLIAAVKSNAWEPLDKKNPYEVPRIKNIDWHGILKKTNAKKLELLIVDPISFTKEVYIEVNAENPQKIKDIMGQAIREANPAQNEARYIMIISIQVYYIDETSQQRKLLFTKFFFFIKNHQLYLKRLKNEKEVVSHYLIILGLLDLRASIETDPFTTSKIDASVKKAFNILKGLEAFPSVLSEWLATKVQPIISVEKVYINLNVGGKADSNFTFNAHEHLMYLFPKFIQTMQKALSQKTSRSPSSASPGSLLVSVRSTVKDSERIDSLPQPSCQPSAIHVESIKEAKTSHRESEKASHVGSITSKNKKELTLTVVDAAEQEKKEESQPAPTAMKLADASTQALESPVNRLSQKIHIEHEYEKGFATKYRYIKEEKAASSFDLYSDKYTGLVINKPKKKFFLGAQRMNTSYGQVLRHSMKSMSNWQEF